MPNVGFCMVNPQPEITPGHVVQVARKCEEIGLHSMWALDRVVYANLEPLTLPAKSVATLDFISDGRFTLGIGFGSRQNDFTSTGAPWEHRGSRAEELVQIMKRLGPGESATHREKFFQRETLAAGPRRVKKPHPPI